MDMQDFLGSNYLKASDYPTPALLTVVSVLQEEVGQDKETKVVMYFQSTPKGLILNKTNIGNMIDITSSSDSDHWIGKKVVLYTDSEVRFQGKRTPALRVRAPKPQAPQRNAPPVAAPVVPDPVQTDEIPF